MLASNRYHWVLEGDIEACFDEISHPALMGRIRDRIGDKRVLALIKAFLCAGVLSEDGVARDSKMGTPQGGILSPLLANIALSVLDDHFAEAWQRDMATRTARGEPDAVEAARPVRETGRRNPSAAMRAGRSGPISLGQPATR
jgi:RNA-directed DNA polymerase